MGLLYHFFYFVEIISEPSIKVILMLVVEAITMII
jgi:hypothetical protein